MWMIKLLSSMLMLINVQNYAHRHPMILELFSLKWISIIILQIMPAH